MLLKPFWALVVRSLFSVSKAAAAKHMGLQL